MAQMPPGYVAPSQIERLRQIGLEMILSSLNCRRDLKDKKKWRSPKGTLSVTGQKFMNWHLGVGGGGAIDLVMHLNSVPFIEAISWLANAFPLTYAQETPHPKQTPQRRKAGIPQRDKSQLPRVINYLTQERCIPEVWLTYLINKGTLYADSRANAVFLLLGKRKKVMGAELRGTRSVAWKGMAPGTDKQNGCFSIKSRKRKTIMLCESAIDAISCFIFYPDCTAVSMAGVCVERNWFRKAIDLGYQLYCAFDNDQTGNLFAEKMIETYPAIHRLKPSCKDWNEMIQHHLPKTPEVPL
jgi:hypothetical protein